MGGGRGVEVKASARHSHAPAHAPGTTGGRSDGSGSGTTARQVATQARALRTGRWQRRDTGRGQ